MVVNARSCVFGIKLTEKLLAWEGRGGMRQRKKSAAEKQAARRFEEFARAVRRNLRRADRIVARAEQAVHRCYEKAGAGMLDAKTSSAISEEGYAAWLTSLGLSQDRLVQCLELGQIVLDRRKADAAERDESFRSIVMGKREISPEAISREEEEWARQLEESTRRGQQELT
jgi:hypothetical protein